MFPSTLCPPPPSQFRRARVAGTRRSIDRTLTGIRHPGRINLQTRGRISRQGTRIRHNKPSHRINHQPWISTHDHPANLTSSRLMNQTIAIHTGLHQPSTTTELSRTLVITRTITRKLNRAIAHSTHLLRRASAPQRAQLYAPSSHSTRFSRPHTRAQRDARSCALPREDHPEPLLHPVNTHTTMESKWETTLTRLPPRSLRPTHHNTCKRFSRESPTQPS